MNAALLAIATKHFGARRNVLRCDPHGEHAVVVVVRVDYGHGLTPHVCGYAVVDHDPCPGVDLESCGDAPCHGGITYDERADGARVVGFDCAHYGDLGDPKFTADWAEAEARRLADWMLSSAASLVGGAS